MSGPGYITLIAPTERFPYKDPSGAEFELRIVDDDTETELRKANKHVSHERGERVVEGNGVGFVADVVDYAIVSWKNIKGRGTDGQSVDLPCTRQFKALLPESIKAEIVRLCLSKEAGAELQKQEKKS